MRVLNTLKNLITMLLFVAIIGIVVFASASEESFEKRAAKIGLAYVMDIPLSGGSSRFDYQSIDENRRRLFIAHLGADMVTVVDIDSMKVIRNVPQIQKPHGILAVPELNQVDVSATGTDQIFAIDEQTGDVTAKIPAGHYPDGIAFDTKTKQLFVSDEHGKTVAVIDPVQGKLIAKIELGGKVGNTHYDPVTGLVYSADQSHNELVEIDPANLKIAARYKLNGCDGPHGFYIDAGSRYAIVTGEGNASYVVFDLEQKKVVSSGKVGDDPDVLAFDKGLKVLYVSSESGVVSAFHVEKENVQKVGESFFAPHAHTVSVDQKTHRVFFPLQSVDGHPVLRVMNPIKGQ